MGIKIDFNQEDIYFKKEGEKQQQRTRTNNPISGKRNSKIRFFTLPGNQVFRIRYIDNNGIAYKDLDIKDNKHPYNHKHIFKNRLKKPKRVLAPNISCAESKILSNIEKQNKRKKSKRRIKSGKN